MDLSLLDYRRRVADCYHRVRATDDPVTAWRDWVHTRDELFAGHPQSPIEDRDGFAGIPLFDHDPTWRLVATFEPAPIETAPIETAPIETADAEPAGVDPVDVEHSGAGVTPFTPLGRLHAHRDGHDLDLEVLWLTGYGGGLFLPFRDATNGEETYGGGRYLLDTVKGADLGHDGDRVVLDFNFAYHPSCVHDDRWSCPLAPASNTLDVAVRAGERC